jgi:putative transcriptional regulator
MIKIHLSKILGEKRITQKKLSELTGIRPGTINAYYHEYIQRINVTDLDKICKALNCKLYELIEYIPNKK